MDRKGRGRLNLSISFNRSDGLNGGRAFNGNILRNCYDFRAATRNGYPSRSHGVEELHHAPMAMARARACRWRLCHAAAASSLERIGSGGGGCSPWRRRRRPPATTAATRDGGGVWPNRDRQKRVRKNAFASGRGAWVWEEEGGAWRGVFAKRFRTIRIAAGGFHCKTCSGRWIFL